MGKITKKHHIKKSFFGSKKINVDAFKKMHINFENNIFLHEVSIKEIGGHALEYDKNTLKKMMEIFRKKLKLKKGEIKLSKDDFEIIQKTIKKHPGQSYLFAKNTLVSIVSTFDMLFVDLFKFYYKKFPEKLSIENKTIRFNDLKNIAKIEDAQNFLIAREIETILIQEGINDRLKILSQSMGIDISTINKQVLDVKKLIKIRNLIVHNGGIADSEYIKKYGDEKIKIGNKIKLSQEYLADSLYLVYFLGSYILQGAQLCFSENLASRDFLLNNVLHTLVGNERHSFSKHIYKFVLNNKVDSLNKKLVVINYCIGLKKQNESIEHIQKVLELEDWSIEKEDFEMCRAALLDKHEDFYFYLNKLIKNKEITKDQINEWIVFHLYEDKPRFKSITKKMKE